MKITWLKYSNQFINAFKRKEVIMPVAANTPHNLPGNSDNLMEKLKQYVRSHGADFLKDKNISSVGIGYKSVNGKPTKELAIQFTVDKKLATTAEIESLGSTKIPESLNVAGIEIPTDVIQRSFVPSYKIVAENIVNARKIRTDPVSPGVSVAHKLVTAGTIGCIVYDRLSGAPYILSNWHVLHGAQGRIGDDILQPGPFDDNRTQLNRLGKLVRSHLGAAGDCAIANIEDRTFDCNICELGITVEQLAEPELDDKLIKSGRTTAVTHGIVTRIHTMAKLNYGLAGEHTIGAFEIGPDEDNPPVNGEISMGGDSGAVWILKGTNGNPLNIMAGLHFAGEGPGDINEHALACYAKSVLEKLEITLTPPQKVQTAFVRTGFDPDFLDQTVDLPRLSNPNFNDAFKLNGSEIIHYTHFSLALSRSRRFAFWVAWNIDGGRLRRFSREGLRFDLDPRIPADLQAGDHLYADNRLDRGHIARRADLVWGGNDEAQMANKDSFFFTNIAPQMDNFNQSSAGGIWGKLEDAVFEEVDVEDIRISVFGGPVLRPDDREYRGLKIPREFFKVLVYIDEGLLKAKAFLLTQNLDQLELLDLSEFKVFEITLAELEQRCGFTFQANLKASDEFAERLLLQPQALAERKPIGKLEEIRW